MCLAGILVLSRKYLLDYDDVLFLFAVMLFFIHKTLCLKLIWILSNIILYPKSRKDALLIQGWIKAKHCTVWYSSESSWAKHCTVWYSAESSWVLSWTESMYNVHTKKHMQYAVGKFVLLWPKESSSYCILGWVNFLEFGFTVCGSCKMSQKN